MENNMSLTNKQKALSIFKWTIRKYLPMSIAYWILLFISFPMVELFTMIVYTSETNFADYVNIMKETASMLSGTFFAAVVMLFSIIITIIALSYMHNKRCVDLFGSFPVSRRTLFFTRYCAVLVTCIVPLIIFGIIGALLTFSDYGMIEVFKNVAHLILGVVSNISFIAFISVCCGTVADVLISYSIINIIYPVCVAICYYFPVSVIPGLLGGYIGVPIYTLFSPIAAPFIGMFGDSKTLNIVWWILFTLVLVAGCSVLCKKRKAETAQNAFAFAAVEIVIKFVTCFSAGFGVGWIFANIGATYESLKAQYIWFFIGMIMGIMIANFLLHLVFHRGLSEYKNSLIECGMVAVATVAFLLIITTGAFGYDERIPDVDEIEEVCLITNRNDKFVVDGKNLLAQYKYDEDTINKFVQLHKNLLKEYRKTKRGLYSIVDSGYYTDYVSDKYYYIELNYKLKNGKTVSRGYNTNYIKVEMPDKLDLRFTVSNETVLDNLPEKYISTLYVNKNGTDYECYSQYDVDKEKNKKEIFSLIDALKKDIKEQGISKTSGSDGFTVRVCFEDSYYNYYRDCSFKIPDTYVNTIRVIKENNFYYTEHGWLEEYVGTMYSVEEAETVGKEGVKTIYFKVPDSWDAGLDIKCMPYDTNCEGFYTELSSDFANCEKVSDNVWKYKVRDIVKEDAKFMFYQFSDDVFNLSGCLKFPEDKNMLVLGKKKKNRDVSNFWRALYEYEWTTYNE